MVNLARPQLLATSGRTGETLAAVAGWAEAAEPRKAIAAARVMALCSLTTEATEALDSLRRRSPAHAPAHILFSVLAGDQGRYDEALEAIDAALAIEPRNELAQSYRSLALLRLGREDEARASFADRGFSDNSGFLVRLTEWAETQWIDSGRFFAPRPWMPPASAAPFTGSRGAATAVAKRAFWKGDWGTVLGALARETERDHPDDDIVFTAAFAAEMEGDCEWALRLLRRLAEGPGDPPDTLSAAMGRNLLRMGEMAEAAGHLGRVLTIGPEDYGANYHLAVLCLAYGQPEAARRLFFRAYERYQVDTLAFQFQRLQSAILSVPSAGVAPQP